mgnify:CR=1 FL=1
MMKLVSRIVICKGNVAHRDEASILYCYMFGKCSTP